MKAQKWYKLKDAKKEMEYQTNIYYFLRMLEFLTLNVLIAKLL